MKPERRRQQVAFPIAGARIRGRLRGFETLWTLDRFAEVIRDEVSRGIARAWPPDRIRWWINTAYELDPRSVPHAAEAIDSVLGLFGLAAADPEPKTHRRHAGAGGTRATARPRTPPAAPMP